VSRPARAHCHGVRDIETIDSELRLVAALRCAARERGGPLPSIDVADALLDERRQLTEWISEPAPDPPLVQRYLLDVSL
jgi:hypothetical protein